MTPYAWSELMSVLFSVLNGVCAMAALSLTLTYWQRYRTAKVLFYCLAYWSLSAAFFLGAQVRLADPWISRDVAQPGRWVFFLLFCILVSIGQVYEWIELIKFLRVKNSAFQDISTGKMDAVSSALVSAQTTIMAAEQTEKAVTNAMKAIEPGVKDESIPPPANEDARR